MVCLVNKDERLPCTFQKDYTSRKLESIIGLSLKPYLAEEGVGLQGEPSLRKTRQLVRDNTSGDGKEPCIYPKSKVEIVNCIIIQIVTNNQPLSQIVSIFKNKGYICGTWMGLESIMLSKVSLMEKDITI